jgi:hypothetical protein
MLSKERIEEWVKGGLACEQPDGCSFRPNEILNHAEFGELARLALLGLKYERLRQAADEMAELLDQIADEPNIIGPRADKMKDRHKVWNRANALSAAYREIVGK